MISRNGDRQYGQPLFLDRLDAAGTARSLDRVALSPATGERGSSYDEGWLQRLIHHFPRTLPIDEIEPGLAGAVAVCMELPTTAGPVDNLLATRRGDLVLTECKLWRNPQARREVVAQIIDYAHAMASWSYEELEAAIARGVTQEGVRPSGTLYQIAGGEHETHEAAFVDAVLRNLRLGRMLLLIVGDGIREGVETLADYLQVHVGLHFTLGIIEYALHRMPGEVGFVVQPRILARTINIERGIVRIERGQPVVLAPPAEQSARGRPTSITEERLFESLAAIDAKLPERLTNFLVRAADYGVTYELSRSLMLKWRDSRGNKFNLGCVYPNGDVATEPVSFTANFVGNVDRAHDYLERLAAAIKGIVCRPRTGNPGHWYLTADGKKLPAIGQLLAVSDEWLAAIEHYTAQLEQAAQATEAAPGE